MYPKPTLSLVRTRFPELLEEVYGEGVTHLVRQSTMHDPHCPGWRVIYEEGLVAIASSGREIG